jgi:hypothetical protein
MTTVAMTLPEAVDSIGGAIEHMNALYGSTVFDEWAVVAFLDRKGKLLHYSGPRKEAFRSNFINDASSFRVDLLRSDHAFGDFHFDRDAAGTRFDAFMTLGEGLFLICNHTTETVTRISADERWLSAQRPFVELSEAVRSAPLNHPM